MTRSSNANHGNGRNEIVDVLIIGSGASGAAVAWSLAETRMRILCLEQGDWMKQSDFPSNGRDWEARRYADFDISPNREPGYRYPINEDNSAMKIANFNGVGAAPSCTPRISRACTHRIFAFGRWMASPMTGRSTTQRWSRSLPRTIA